MIDLDTRVHRLPISVRTMNALYEFKTLADIVSYVESYGDRVLLRLPNMGKKGMKEVMAIVDEVRSTNSKAGHGDEFLHWCLRNKQVLESLRRTIDKLA